MNYLIDDLAEYVANLKYEDLTKETIEKAKQVILDSYGNIVFGRYCETSENIMTYAEMADLEMKNEKNASLIGIEKKWTGFDNAVFVHTMMARCADLDDGYKHAMGHPGSGLVPLLLSASQIYKKNGQEIITAIVAAYDIYARLGEAINPFMYREKGFDATGICGAVAGAALISKLKNLDAKKIKNAMGIASLFTGGLIEYQNDGTSGKIMCSGWAALTGIRAMRLAECGFTGPTAALEGKYGFFQAFKGTSGHCDTRYVLSNLGSNFKINDIYFKRHACQRGLHAVLDIILDLKEKYNLKPSIVKSIDIKTSSFVYRLSNTNPITAIGAQASVQFTSAIAMKYGRMDSEMLVFKSFKDPEIKELINKIKVTLDEDIQKYLEKNPTHFCTGEVVITTTENKVYEKWKAVPLGDKETPFTWNILEKKFNNLVKETPFDEYKKIKFEFIKNLENQNNIESLFQI